MMTTRRFWRALVCLAALVIASCSRTAVPPKQVVFVCEHGAARSVIAAAWFNKLAEEKHMPYRAVARGVTPQEALSKAAVAGLKSDGVSFADEKPSALTAQEAKGAARVVSFFPLPTSVRPGRVDEFDVPAPGDGYDKSRDAILVPVRKLIDELYEKRGN